MKKTDKRISIRNYNSLLERLAVILNQARGKIVREINKAQVLAYWEIGREIVEFEQKGKARAEYGEELIKKLSRDMTEKFGRGFSEINIRNMRRFYLEFPTQIQQTLSVKSLKRQKLQAVSGKSKTVSRKSVKSETPSDQFEPMLSWSHYCELLKVEEQLARAFYEQEVIQNNWSVRELKKQKMKMTRLVLYSVLKNATFLPSMYLED